jgi:histidinol-phosphate/aromatic aminotransferase/cobyric acid decarboxylase-like protein
MLITPEQVAPNEPFKPFVVWEEVPCPLCAGRNATPVIEAFKSRGILVGRKFPSMEQWLRVTIGTREETVAFLAALREIVPARTAAA